MPSHTTAYDPFRILLKVVDTHLTKPTTKRDDRYNSTTI